MNSSACASLYLQVQHSLEFFKNILGKVLVRPGIRCNILCVSDCTIVGLCAGCWMDRWYVLVGRDLEVRMISSLLILCRNYLFLDPFIGVPCGARIDYFNIKWIVFVVAE